MDGDLLIIIGTVGILAFVCFGIPAIIAIRNGKSDEDKEEDEDEDDEDIRYNEVSEFSPNRDCMFIASGEYKGDCMLAEHFASEIGESGKCDKKICPLWQIWKTGGPNLGP